MQYEIRNSTGCDEDTKTYFVDAKNNSTLVNPDDTAVKMVTILEKGDYESGAHVDYFDEM
jgi:sepiapterin reductase